MKLAHRLPIADCRSPIADQNNTKEKTISVSSIPVSKVTVTRLHGASHASSSSTHFTAHHTAGHRCKAAYNNSANLPFEKLEKETWETEKKPHCYPRDHASEMAKSTYTLDEETCCCSCPINFESTE